MQAISTHFFYHDSFIDSWFKLIFDWLITARVRAISIISSQSKASESINFGTFKSTL